MWNLQCCFQLQYIGEWWDNCNSSKTGKGEGGGHCCSIIESDFGLHLIRISTNHKGEIWVETSVHFLFSSLLFIMSWGIFDAFMPGTIAWKSLKYEGFARMGSERTFCLNGSSMFSHMQFEWDLSWAFHNQGAEGGAGAYLNWKHEFGIEWCFYSYPTKLMSISSCLLRTWWNSTHSPVQHQYMSQKLALLDAQMAKMLTTHKHTRELLKK